MAGIGFVLRRITQQDNLIGVVSGYGYATLISAGPWLFTVLCLGGISLFSVGLVRLEELVLFRIIVVYNFAFSLTMTAPVVVMVTRFVSDRIYSRDVSDAHGALIGALMLAFLIQAPIVLWFYGIYTDMTPGERLGAVMNYFLTTMVWLCAVFITALKAYRTIALVFAFGMALSLFVSPYLMDLYGTAGLMTAFNIGLTLIAFSLVARIFAEYPYLLKGITPYRGYIRRMWLLELAFFFGTMAIWIDKWIMWFAPEHDVHPSGMIYFGLYDSALFLAYLAMMPALAMFILYVETGFFSNYRQYFADIREHGTLARVLEGQERLIASLLGGMRNLVVVQGAFCLILIMAAPQIFQFFGIPLTMLGIFRFAVIGAFFQMLVQAMITVLSYFDLRASILAVSLFFVITNGLCTWATFSFGFAFYGAGYMVSAAASAVFAYGLTFRHLGNLPFLTFVANNPGLVR